MEITRHHVVRSALVAALELSDTSRSSQGAEPYEQDGPRGRFFPSLEKLSAGNLRQFLRTARAGAVVRVCQ